MKDAMSVLSSCKSYFRILGFLSVFGVALAGRAQSVTWQILPFPQNSDWPGPRGAPATTNGNVVTLQGQPVRSTQTFTPGTTFTFNVVLESRPTGPGDDGALWFFLIPTGLPTNLDLTSYLLLEMAFRNYEPDGLAISQSGTQIGSDIPFPIVAQVTNHVSISVSESGLLTWAINGQVYSSGTVSVAYSPFQVQMDGWQPTDVWQVSDFTVGTPSTCPNLVGTWTGQMNVANPWNGYSTTPLSVRVTDQTTNGCLIRGYLTQGSVISSFPLVRWNPWFRLPFTGAIPDGSTVLLNVSGAGTGKASATLDMSQTPPVLQQFIYQPSNGETVSGNLTLQPASP